MQPTNQPPPNLPVDFNWHAQDIDAVYSHIASGKHGLSAADIETRRQQFGLNRLRPPARRSTLQRFLVQFHNVLIYVLLVAGVVTSLLGHWVDSGVIFAVVVINALIGFIQEGKAERAMEAVRNMLSPQCTVLRDGVRTILPAEQLVPGDVVFVQSGDKVPADIRITHSKELRVDEAMLTGESLPVEKSTRSVNEKAVIGDRTCMGYSGTLITFGQGSGVVVATGDNTEIGRISMMLHEVQTLTTPLLKQIAVFAKWLTIAILILALATMLFGMMIHQFTASDMFLAAVGLAVAAIPEGLPAIITITLAIGVQRMAKFNAIIRRLPAVETLGSVTTICSDKTGTLTRNEMTVKQVALAQIKYTISGTGYNPHGYFAQDTQPIEPDEHAELQELCQAAMLCNDAAIREQDGKWIVDGDPTEGALVTMAVKAEFNHTLLQEEIPRMDVIPFESQHRFMATLHHDHAGHGFIYIKGAPEVVLQRCHKQRMHGEDRALDIQYWEQQLDQITRSGHRALAIGFKTADMHQKELQFEDVDGGITLLGLVGLIDPPREEAIAAVRECQHAGIRVRMITGDHAGTAKAVAAQLNIGTEFGTLTGDQLASLSDTDLSARIEETDIFARASPEHKLRIVTALQARDHVVAMTGDGVNDAPALKRADVGVAMGIKGTEAAKEASEMVLVDDNFATIVHAIKEGRTVFDNIKKSILFILPTNGGQALTVVAAILLGRMLPVTAVQILWVNMITAVTLALALAFEPPEPNVMERNPRQPNEPILSGFMIWRISFVSVIMVVVTFGLFIWERNQGASIETARTVAVNTLVMLEVFYLLSARFLFEKALTRNGLFGNQYVLITIALVLFFQILFTYTPIMQLFFNTTAISAQSWINITIAGIILFILVETEKWIFRRWVFNSHAHSIND